MKFWAFRFGTVLGERCRRGAIWDFEHKLSEEPCRARDTREREAEQRLPLGGRLRGRDNARVPEELEAGEHIQPRASGADYRGRAGGHRDRGDGAVRRAEALHGRSVVGSATTRWSTCRSRRYRSLGWRPKSSPEEIIRQTARWTLQELGGGRGPASPAWGLSAMSSVAVTGGRGVPWEQSREAAPR